MQAGSIGATTESLWDLAMDYGKLASIRGVDFALPEDDPSNAECVVREPNAVPKVLVGVPAWGEPRWLGRVYPRGSKPGEFLRHYASQFPTIELNSTFYGVPAPSTVDKWRAQTPASFRFCAKIVRDVSHEPDLSAAIAALGRYLDVMTPLGERLGAFFLQWPPEVGPAEGALVAAVLDAWPRELRLVVEFRHPDWFTGGRLVAAARRMLERRQMGTVVCDVAGRRDACHSSLTADVMMLRLVGNDLHATDMVRAVDWSKRIGTWLDLGLDTAYVMAHQPDNVRAPEYANILSDNLRHHTGLNVQKWRPVASQMKLF